MVKIINLRTYGIEESIIASRYPMMTGKPAEMKLTQRNHESYTDSDELLSVKAMEEVKNKAGNFYDKD